MATKRHHLPDLFDDHGPDPVEAATGRRGPRAASEPKRKAGFYLSDELLGRFNTRYYELKLAGASVGNKSTLLEAALAFALEDLERGANSTLLKRFARGGRPR
ncbi:MAG TPA: hypothetical protein VLH81_05635 [Desulfobacterales bacterium]|nr:hypothetical protein [Desulfobacterales bacterium]